MRDLLTGLAIVLIVILTTALAAPYFVDWNAQRGFLEARLSRALGQRVTIGGAIDLRLLPTPYLSLRRTTIGNEDGPIALAVQTLDLELSVAPLLHGEFDITEARLGEPTLRVTLGRDRTLPVLPAAPAFGVDVAFERVDVSDGTLAIADPLSDRTYVFEHLDLSAEAPSLAGPIKVAGSGGAADARTPFRFSTTSAPDGRTRLRFNAGETTRHPGLDLEGTFAPKDAGPGARSGAFEGTLALSGRTSLDAAPIPWRLAGALTAGPQGATLAGGELRLGTERAGLTLAATARGAFGEAPGLALALAAKQLDIDRLSGAPVDARRPPPPKPPTLAGLREALARTKPPIPTAVDLAVDNATWGGETLGAIKAHWEGDGAGPQAVRLAGDGPGGSHLAADGTLSAAGFTGALDLSAGNLPAALDWLARIDPGDVGGRDALPFRAAGIAGHVTAGITGVDADALTLRLDASTLTGSGHLAFADGSRPARLALALRTGALDLGTLPSLASLRAATTPYDVDLSLDADKVALGGEAPLDAGPVGLTLAKSGGLVTIDRLRARDLGGATIDARGRLDAQGATVNAALEANRLDAAAAFLRRLLPGAGTDALAARAETLVPARLTIDLGLTAGADGALRPRRLAIAGRAGGTDVKATLAPEGDDGVTLDAGLDAPDGGRLLRQLGFATLPLGDVGRGRVTLRGHGPAGQPINTTAHAALGATELDVTGRFDLLAGARPGGGSGGAHLKSPDLGPLLQALDLAVPDATARVPADLRGTLALDRAGVAVTGLTGSVGGVAAKGDLRWRGGAGEAPAALTGTLGLARVHLATLLALALGPARPAAGGARYSSERFSGGLLDPPRTRLTLALAGLDLADGLGATDASLDLGIAPGVVTLGHMAATLAGGRLTGGLSLRRAGADATIEGRLALDGARLALPGANAVVSGTLDVAGGGSSPAALVASLAGSGTAQANGLGVPHAAPAALPKVFADVEADRLAVDEDSIARALQDASTGPVDLGDRGFDLSLAGGVLHVAPSGPPPPRRTPVGSAFEATFDLRTGRLEERVRETLTALPPNWTGAAPTVVFTLAGPVEDPRRSTDVGGLVDAVATRALARETARIEAYETDIRERAFFAQRLQSEGRREQDRLKVEDDARRADADRKAKLEAARLERLRKEEATRAAAARTEQGITEAIQARAAAARAAREKAIQDRGQGDGTGQDQTGQDGTGRDGTGQDGTGQDGRERRDRTERTPDPDPSGAAPRASSDAAPYR